MGLCYTHFCVYQLLECKNVDNFKRHACMFATSVFEDHELKQTNSPVINFMIVQEPGQCHIKFLFERTKVTDQSDEDSWS